MNSITLSNRQRLTVPAASLAIVVVTFVPAIVLSGRENVSPITFTVGCVIFAAAVWSLAWSMFRAPFEMTIGPTIEVKRLRRRSQFDRKAVTDWTFIHPDGGPSRKPVTTHGLILIRLADGTRFRAEVNADEARAAAELLA